jgi:hypothetical protein
MGRPLNKKYFGNRNIGSVSTTADDKIGGNSIASVTISGSWSGFTQATSTVTFSAPELPNGVTATGTVTITAGAPASVTITEAGSGYVSLPTVTIADSDVGAETSGTATAVFAIDTGNIRSATNDENAIICYAKTTTGGTRQIADIIKQVSTTRYKVKTADGIAICKLRTDGGTGTYTMDISAYDTAGAGAGEYWVSKLTARNVTLVAKGVNGGSDFTNGKKVKWTYGSAVAPSGSDIGTAKIQNA